MSSKLIEIADAVVDMLNDEASEYGSFTQSFTAERVYDPVYDSATEDEIKVLVIPITARINLEGTRAFTLNSYQVTIAVYQRVSSVKAEQISEVDELVEFVQEVTDLFRQNKRLLITPAASLRDISVIVYDAGMLQTKSTFVSLIQLEYGLFE